MKTAQIMNRKVLGVPFTQNHKSEMVNLTQFIRELGQAKKSIESTTSNSGCQPELEAFDIVKDFSDSQTYFRNIKVVALMKVIAEDEDVEVSELAVSKCGKYGGTWVHPLLFVDYLMWISPKFHYAGLKLIYDNVLKYRDAGGDSFKRVNAALLDNSYVITGREYADLARAVAQKCEVPTMIEVSSSGKQKIKYDWNAANEEVLDARTKINNQLEGIINLRFLEDVSSIIASLNKL